MIETKDMIYLIQPNGFTLDITYRVLAKDDYIYFCRCGGQMYTIADEKSSYTEKELLEHKRSFCLRKDEIDSITINSKISFWTGHIANEGTVVIEMANGEKKRKFIIHAASDVKEVKKFFKRNVGCEVKMIINQQREHREKMNEKIEKKEPQVKAQMRMVALLLNIIAVIISIATFLFLSDVESRKVAIIILLIIPLISILFYVINSTYICLVDLRGERRPQVAVAVLLPSAAMGLIGLFSAHYRNQALLQSTVIAVVIGTVLSVIVLAITKEYKSTKWIFLGLLFVFVFYLNSMIIATNLYFDTSLSNRQVVQVLDKQISRSGRGKGTDYNLLIEDWTGEDEYLYADVRQERFERIDEGDYVEAYIFTGLWNVEWFVVREIE